MELVYKKEFREEAAALVYKIDDDYEVYEIPQFGGEPRFEGIFNSLEEAMYYVNLIP